MPSLSSQIFSRSGSNITLRSLAPGDEPAYLAFVKKCTEETTHTLKYEGMVLPTIEELEKSWADCQNHPVNIALGAFVNQDLVGHMRCGQPWAQHPWLRHIVRFGMAVSKDLWGHGIGSKMISIMESEMRRAGIVRIEAEVRTANMRGVELYKKNGFKIEGTREKAALIDGQYLDEYFIAKILG